MNSNKVLFICQDYTIANEGLSVVTRRNLRLLKRCGFEVEEILVKTPSTWTKLRNILLGESYGYNHEVDKQIKESLQKEYRFVFFDRSLFGSIVKRFAEKGFRTICFYHNVEGNLSKIRLIVVKNPLYWFLYRNICLNERYATEYAHTHISISERDQQELKYKYGINDVFLMPTSFIPVPSGYIKRKKSSTDTYCLFVGSGFFANREGMSWFVKEVAPGISCNTRVVGSICNYLRMHELPPNVQLVGYVDDLNEYYANAMCVVSPILSGSGLKTKTIEALRYGKTVFGTSEAFAGIRADLYNRIGRLCNTKDDFINAINTCCKEPKLINKTSLEVFNDYFSDDVAYKTFCSIINRMEL